MATALLTQKYTNDVQTNSQKHFGYLTPRMYAYRDKVLNKNRILMLNELYLQTKLTVSTKHSRWF